MGTPLTLDRVFRFINNSILSKSFLLFLVIIVAILNITNTPSLYLLLLPSALFYLHLTFQRAKVNHEAPQQFYLSFVEDDQVMVEEFHLPPILNLLDARDLTEVLFSGLERDFQLNYQDLVFRILRNLYYSPYSWNLEALSSALDDISILLPKISPFISPEDELFFEAYVSGLIKVDKKFKEKISTIVRDLRFLHAGFYPVFNVEQQFNVKVPKLTDISKQTLANLLKRVNVSYYFSV